MVELSDEIIYKKRRLLRIALKNAGGTDYSEGMASPLICATKIKFTLKVPSFLH